MFRCSHTIIRERINALPENNGYITWDLHTFMLVYLLQLFLKYKIFQTKF